MMFSNLRPNPPKVTTKRSMRFPLRNPRLKKMVKKLSQMPKRLPRQSSMVRDSSVSRASSMTLCSCVRTSRRLFPNLSGLTLTTSLSHLLSSTQFREDLLRVLSAPQSRSSQSGLPSQRTSSQRAKMTRLLLTHLALPRVRITRRKTLAPSSRP